MNILLIVVGVVLIVVGVFRMTTEKKDEFQSFEKESSVAVVERHSNETTAAPTAAQKVQDIPKEEVKSESSAVDYAKEKGNGFEDFVANLLADHRFKLLERTCDQVSSAGVVAESCKNPDFKVQQERGKSNVKYYLECKYRTRWDNGVVTFDKWQLDRYRQFQRDNRTKVIIALGVGGTPDNPATFRLVPLDSIQSTSIKRVNTQFAVQPTSDNLFNYMTKYFDEVFDAAKARKQNK